MEIHEANVVSLRSKKHGTVYSLQEIIHPDLYVLEVGHPVKGSYEPQRLTLSYTELVGLRKLLDTMGIAAPEDYED